MRNSSGSLAIFAAIRPHLIIEQLGCAFSLQKPRLLVDWREKFIPRSRKRRLGDDTFFWSDPEQVRRPACRPIAACRGRTQSRRSYAWAGGFAVKSNHFGLRACRLVKSHAAAPAAWRYSPQSFAPHPSSATSPLLAALGSNSGDCASSFTPSSPRNSIPCSSKTCRIAWRFRTCIEGVPLTRSPRVIADCEMPHW